MKRAGRAFLKSPINAPEDLLESDEDRGIEAPVCQKPYPKDAELIDLIAPEQLAVGRAPLIDIIKQRKSRRRYTEASLTLEEFSFLLWATQGVRRGRGKDVETRRTVPASGGIHPFETYVVVNRVEGIQPGLYRYVALEHKLLRVSGIDDEWLKRLVYACRGQAFVSTGAVVFVWTAVPYRTEWRYANEAHKAIAQSSGHLCQNLYLASESIGGGTCAVTAYAQNEMDVLLGVDGEEEFTIYVAPVGKVRS